MAERRTNLEILLSDWGAWKRGETRQFLGYPERPAFMTERVDRTAWDNSAPNVPLIDDDLRRVDVAIDELHPDLRVVVAAHYTWEGLDKQRYDRLKMARTAYYDHLKYAQRQLAYAMGSKYMQGYEASVVMA